MIWHVVTFTFAVDTAPTAYEQIAAALDAYAAQQPVLRSYQHGKDLGLRQGNADYAVVASVDDEASLTAYLEHPEHVRIVAELIKPVLVSRNAVQFSD